MKTSPHLSRNLRCAVCNFYIILVVISVDSAPPIAPPVDCPLNFSSFPFQPTGECILSKDKITVWGGISTTICCRNALQTLSLALAQHAKSNNTDDNLFLPQQQWTSCSTVSLSEHQNVSAKPCGFADFYHQEDNICSDVSLSSIQSTTDYHGTLQKCRGFDSSFNDVCRECMAGIVQMRDTLLEGLRKKEKPGCALAAVVSVAAGLLDDPSEVDGFYRCLRSLDVYGAGYIKIRASVAKILLALFLATIGMTITIMLIKHVTRNTKRELKPLKIKNISKWTGLYRFSKAEIENAIHFGAEVKFLGRGSAGQVFQGVLPSGQVVAVKQIYKSNTSDSFSQEVEALSRVRHKNLVALFGCCVEDGEQYLVYEYCSSGNLAQQLLKKDTPLTWGKRVQILRDCAVALRYLHRHDDGCIVHRDIKLTNILLTESMEPKLSDFGLAKMLNMEQSKVFTDVRGTIGYMDPEYMVNAHLTCASDIYSFGIVMLQVLSGQRVIELDLDARDQLTRKAKDVNVGDRPLTDFEDPKLNGKLNRVDFESILQIAVLCVARSSKGRPDIDVVLNELDKAWKNAKAEEKARKESSSATFSESRRIGDSLV